MYNDFFGFSELPFTLTPNTRFFLQLPTHQEAQGLIRVALQNGDGFIKVVGEVGTGKTLICRTLLNELDAEDYVTAYIPNPYLKPEEFRRSFALELGLAADPSVQDYELIQTINQKLIALAKEQRRVVLIVDEAQAMPEETIEALRLLTNLETESAKLFQVVLFGQPELDTLLARPSLRQLQQRITFSYKLRQLSTDEVRHYIEQRMVRAGFEGLSMFDAGAVRCVAAASKGVPRLVNILCHKALMVAFGKGEKRVRKSYVVKAVADTEPLQLPLLTRFALPLALAGLSLCGSLAVLFAISGGAL